MDKYISLDELMKFPIRFDHYDKEHGNIDFLCGIETILEYAQYIVPVDAVKVVRCKNCIHCRNYDGKRYCKVWGGVNGEGDDGFCNYVCEREE